MFHWICPECGREIAPSVRECSACEPKTAVPRAVAGGASPGPRSESRGVLAPLQDYSSAASGVIQAVAPDLRIFTPESLPRVTVPGPALPPELASLQDINLATAPGGKPYSHAYLNAFQQSAATPANHPARASYSRLLRYTAHRICFAAATLLKRGINFGTRRA